MPYFLERLSRICNDYGHLTGTLIIRIKQEITAKDTFALTGMIIQTKGHTENIIDMAQSVRKHCEYIDAIQGSSYTASIDKLRNTLRNKTLNSIELLMKNAIRKDFDSCQKLLEEAKLELSCLTETVLELLNLKETFNLQSLPADYIELFETGELKYIGKVFLSYCMTNENEIMVNNLVSPFLEELGFQTIYASRDFPPNKAPGQNAEEFIKKCGTIIAFLTQDRGEYPSANVIHEIGVASDKVVILFVEKGTQVPSNLSTSATYCTFERQNTGDMLLKMVHSLHLAKVYRVPKNDSTKP